MIAEIAGRNIPRAGFLWEKSGATGGKDYAHPD
jgi:hypothetical protein